MVFLSIKANSRSFSQNRKTLIYQQKTGMPCKYWHPVLVEVRGIEPLSEDSNPWISPSADSGFKFPPPAAHCQAAGLGSFILPGSPQSLGGPVPHIICAGDSSRERLRPTFRGLRPRKLTSDCCQLFVFPVVARYRGRGSLAMCPTIPVETSAPPWRGWRTDPPATDCIIP